MSTKRTTHRHPATKQKRYLVHDARGRITDNQAHANVSRVDQRVTTISEAEKRVVRAAMKWRRDHGALGRATDSNIVQRRLNLGVTNGELHTACDKLTAARASARKRKVAK